VIENPTITTERLRVRYGETDMMGHVYYANYFFWFEQARGAWCRERGFTYLELESRGFKLPAVEAQANYKAEVLYDDIIAVRVWVSQIKRTSLRFDYEVVNETRGVVATLGHTWHVLIGADRRPTAIPEFLREWMAREPDPSLNPRP
jgi:acyl-CoA thioester hydrolase